MKWVKIKGSVLFHAVKKDLGSVGHTFYCGKGCAKRDVKVSQDVHPPSGLQCHSCKQSLEKLPHAN